MSGGAILDGLLRELAREAAAECAAAFRRDLRAILVEELARQHGPVQAPAAGYVSVKAAAKLAGVHESTIRDWLRAGKLRGYQPKPRVLRVRVDELHALMACSSGEVIDFDDRVRALTSRAAKFSTKK